MIPFPDISPEIFSISLFGITFTLRWYALAYIVGIIIGWRIVVHAVKRPLLWPARNSPMTEEQVEDLLTWVILGVILGGRLGYVLFYKPSYYLANPLEIPMVWQGGMAFHGGFLGVVLAAWFFARHNTIPKLAIADALAMATPPALLLGRIANFINAELWGRPTDVPWGVIFPNAPCPEIASICARHPSQIYEAAMEGLILGAVLLWLVYRRKALKTPGFVTGVFFAGYGIARFIVEFFRQADAQFMNIDNPMGYALHVNGYGITMGQTLSLPMVIVGFGLILYARRA